MEEARVKEVEKVEEERGELSTGDVCKISSECYNSCCAKNIEGSTYNRFTAGKVYTYDEKNAIDSSVYMNIISQATYNEVDDTYTTKAGKVYLSADVNFRPELTQNPLNNQTYTM